jgi:hypothetical protein
MSPSIPEELERWYHQMRTRFGTQLHAFVKAEAEHEARVRRKFHVHVCVICTSWAVSYLFSLTGVATTLVVTGSPAIFLLIQELFDNIGKF